LLVVEHVTKYTLEFTQFHIASIISIMTFLGGYHNIMVRAKVKCKMELSTTSTIFYKEEGGKKT